MKKVLVTFAFVLAAHVGFAQDAAFKKDVLKLVEVSGSTGAMKAAKDQIINMIPEAKRPEFEKEFDALMPALYDKIAVIYMETYTKEDIKEMLKFYSTPIGKKMSSKAGEIAAKSMVVGQEWAAESMQDLMMKYLQ